MAGALVSLQIAGALVSLQMAGALASSQIAGAHAPLQIAGAATAFANGRCPRHSNMAAVLADPLPKPGALEKLTRNSLERDGEKLSSAHSVRRTTRASASGLRMLGLILWGVVKDREGRGSLASQGLPPNPPDATAGFPDMRCVGV